MRIATVLSVFLLFIPVTGYCDTLHVPGSYSTIQWAIWNAENGDTVLVEPGVYKEKINFLGKAITVTSSQGPEGTIIDGKQSGSVVTFTGGEGPDSVINGFTITNGFTTVYGGGVFCLDTSPTISGNLITGNTCGTGTVCPYGSGIYSDGGAPVINGNTISDNLVLSEAGIHSYGGGVYCRENAPVIMNNLFTSNESTADGGGYGLGGGLCLWLCTAEVVNNAFVDNFAGRYGGGMYVYKSAGIFTCNTFSTNRAAGAGGAVTWWGCTLTVTNSIFANDEAPGGNEMYVGDSYNPSHITLEYCDVEDGQAAVSISSGSTLNWGAGMLESDPELMDAEKGGYHLGAGSPCIDAGDGTASGVPSTDIDGEVRLFDGDNDGSADLDLGCDEIRCFLVPQGYPTIQSAIDAACPMGVVGVSTGWYHENLDFKGKVVTVISTDGTTATWLDGDKLGRVVTFQNGEGADSVLEGFTIKNGIGGILCDAASPSIIGNVIEKNSTTDGGGGILCQMGAPLIVANIIKNNDAVGGGGAALMGGAPVLVNNMIHDNSAVDGGGLKMSAGSNAVVTNNTLCRNTAALAGGGIHCGGESTEITNTVLWDNAAPAGAQIEGANAVVTHCDVQGGWPGAGNIDTDPLFKKPGTVDFHLDASSPCIDAASSSASALPSEDFEGDPRSMYLGVDMGADEYAEGKKLLYVPAEYPTIQDAISAAQAGDTILVAPGTYVENIDFMAKAVRVISADGPAVTAIDGNQSGSVVTFPAGCGPGSVLDGFTIFNGTGSLNYTKIYGGGIFCINGSPKIKNNIVRDCHAEDGGGGIYCDDSEALIEGNDIFDNSARSGAGIYSYDSDATIVGNRVFDNAATSAGGGMFCSGMAFVVDSNLIISNSARAGGGIYCFKSSMGFEPVVSNNIIAFNIATEEGGGANIRRALFTNNTVYGNLAHYGGGCCFSFAQNYTNNCIFWNNTATSDGKEIFVEDVPGTGTALFVNYADIEGGISSIYVQSGCYLGMGAGNIDVDPEFVDRSNGDFHLLYSSPCREAGVRDCPGFPVTDFEGDPRIEFNFPDIGADEFATHLYYTGNATPGGAIEGKLVGVPGISPVGLFIGSGLLQSPLSTMWGYFYLKAPWLLFGPLGTIPADGVMVIPATLPGAPPAPYDVPMQALIGSTLTNLSVIEVR